MPIEILSWRKQGRIPPPFDPHKGVKVMKIKMTQTIKGAADPSGIRAKTYEAGKTYDVHEELAQVFIRERWAKKNKEEKVPEETKDLKASEENKELEGAEETKEEAPPETKDEELAKTDDGLKEPKVEKPPEPEKKDKK